MRQGWTPVYDQSASIILAGGIQAVIAESFDVLFSRHAVNRGLLLVSCSTAGIETGDELQVDVESGLVRCVARGLEQPCRAPKPRVLEWLAEGGAIEYLRKHGHL
jgi:3-isopropylmalate/(R)-2-methylmalate dehydratase small subunit